MTKEIVNQIDLNLYSVSKKSQKLKHHIPWFYSTIVIITIPQSNSCLGLDSTSSVRGVSALCGFYKKFE